MTNYYDIEKDILKDSDLKNFEVVKRQHFNSKDKLNEVKKNPDNWVILIDPDVDKATLYDKERNIAYDLTYKGYELTDLEPELTNGIDVKHRYLHDYLWTNRQKEMTIEDFNNKYSISVLTEAEIKAEISNSEKDTLSYGNIKTMHNNIEYLVYDKNNKEVFISSVNNDFDLLQELANEFNITELKQNQ